VVVVGDVVRLRDELGWFERLPLFGLGVLVTRTRKQSGGFAETLREVGAAVFQEPVIDIRPVSDWSAVDAAIERLDRYDWVIFTSANGVEHFCQRLWTKGGDARHFGRGRICAIGPETARPLERFGLRADLIPPAYVAEAAAEALRPFAPKRALLPRSRLARDVLPDALRQAGTEVDVVDVYSIELPEGGRDRLMQLLNSGKVQVVTFTSSSTVSHFMRMAGELPSDLTVACIGPITRRTAEEHGLRVDIEATTYTAAGLKDALVEHYRLLRV